MNKPLIIYVMGVSGSGKSTIGKELAKALNFPFFDGDDYHPAANIKKMSTGKPLNDMDRKGWLHCLNKIALEHKDNGAVIVCSALKEKYRNQLKNNLDSNCIFLYLKGSLEEISNRLSERKGHFMPKELLASQFETLEEPTEAISISILKSPQAIVKEFISILLK